MKKFIILTILLASFIFTQGCASGVPVKVLIPPRDNVAGIRKVLVVPVVKDFSLESRSVVREVGDALHLAIRTSPVYSSSEIKTFENTATGTTDNGSFLPTAEELKKMGSESGVDAAILVRVLNYDASVVPPSPFNVGVSYGRWYGNRGYWVSHQTRDTYYLRGGINAMFTMVRLEDMSVISEQRIPVNISDHSYGPVGERDLLSKLARVAAEEYMKFISISDAIVTRYFLQSKYSENSDVAVQWAYDGRWEKAARLWMETADEIPEDPAPVFNLGIYYERVARYNEALDHYMAARELTGSAEAFSREIMTARNSVIALSFIRDNADKDEATPEDTETPETEKPSDKPEKAAEQPENGKNE